MAIAYSGGGSASNKYQPYVGMGDFQQAQRQEAQKAKPKSTSPGYISYKIRSGDTLSDIARRYGTSVSSLMAINNISNPNRIAAGASLKIPTSSTTKAPSVTKTSAPKTSTPKTSTSGGYTSYKIRSGDTLSQIAQRYGTTVSALMAANNISNPNKIYAGATIKIPGKGGGSASKPTTSTPAKGTPTTKPAPSTTPAPSDRSPLSTIPAIAPITVPNKTDEQLRQEAENLINPQYNAQREAFQQAAERLIEQYNAQKTGLEPQYQQAQQVLEQQGEQAKQTASNEALSRGLARSSVAIDMIGEVDQQLANSLAQIQQEKLRAVQEIDNQIALTQQQLADSIKRLDTDKATQISAQLQQLKNQQQQAAIDAQQYNNTLAQWAMQMQEQIKAQQQQQALNEAQLTGVYNGRPTLGAQQLAANIDAQRAQQELARQQFEFSKSMQQQQLQLQKTQQAFENSLRSKQMQIDAEAKKMATYRPIGMNLLQMTIQNSLNNGYTPDEIRKSLISSATDWASKYGIDVDTMLDIFNATTNAYQKQQASSSSGTIDAILKGLGVRPNSPSGSNATSSLGKLSSGNKTLDSLIVKAAQTAGVPATILSALVKAESGYRQNARSSAGAIGLTQLMPGTAKGLKVNPYDTWENLLGGAKYLASQFKRFGDWSLALAAYNAGPGNVQKYGGIPPFKETQNYVKRIFGYLGWG